MIGFGRGLDVCLESFAVRGRLVWLAGDSDQADTLARELHRSRTMVKKYDARRESHIATRERQGFSTLTSWAYRVVWPIEQAVPDTDAKAIAAALSDFQDPFLVRLRRAEDIAEERLDAIPTEGPRPPIMSVELGLRRRELASEADVEALVSAIRTRVFKIRAGARESGWCEPA